MAQAMTAPALDRVRVRTKQAEGFRAHPYVDTAGKLTIGYGRNLTADGISEVEACALLEHDLLNAVHAVAWALPWTLALNDARQEVLVELEFNLGLAGEEGFTQMLGHLQRGEYAAAGAALLDSRLVTEEHARAEQWAQQLESGLSV